MSTPRTEQVRSASFRGWLPTIGASVIAKLAMAAAQLALAWFLIPEDYGLVGVAMGVNTIAVLLVSGQREALIQRGPAFDTDASDFFWLSLVTYLVGGLLVACAAPVASVVVGNPRVVGVVLVAALTVVFQAFTTIPAAVLARNLAFVAQARISLTGAIITSATSVLLAALGLGPYSLLLPICLAAPVTTLLMLRAAKQPAIRRPQIRRWPGLLAPVVWLMLQNAAASLGVFGPAVLIAHQLGAHDAGVFQWAYTLAFQLPFVLVGQLRGVLLPSFVALQTDDAARASIYEESLHLLLRLNGLACLLQAAGAGVLVGGFFPERWQDSAGSVMWLSLGLATYPGAVISNALFVARGRFKVWAAIIATQTVVILASTHFAGRAGDVEEVATVVGAVLFLSGAVLGGLPLRRERIGAYLSGLARVALALAAATPLAFYGVRTVSAGNVSMWAIGAAILALATYLAVSGLWHRGAYAQLRSALRRE